MATTAMVHVRIDENVKLKASETFSAMGLSMSDAIRVFLTRVAAEQQLPFDLRVPNTQTLTAMQEAEEIVSARKARFNSPEDLLDAIEKSSNK